MSNFSSLFLLSLGLTTFKLIKNRDLHLFVLVIIVVFSKD